MTTNFGEATREALEFLRSKNSVGMIATVDSEGQPYVSPVYFVMGSEFDLFFLTTKGTHKSKNIEVNSKVAFSVGTGPEYISVMIRGDASIPNSDEQNQALAKMTEVLEKVKAFKWPLRTLEDLKDQNLVLYKITPKKVTFLNINSTQEPKSNADHLYHLVD
jgi:nitroimidazol reductase NimA-like FMN-containing flavoprotein (pyridoxamine 5'-phosphate oxidase superfamily)